jgi:hypothetical protein
MRPRVQRAPGLPCALFLFWGRGYLQTSDRCCRENAFRRPGERRDPYVDGPRATRVFSGSDRIACIHMSGLLMRLVDRWPRWFPRREFQTLQRPLQANGSHGVSRTSDRSILPSDLLLQLRLSRSTTSPTGRSLKRRRMHQTSAHHRNSRPSSTASRRCGQSCWRARSLQAWATCAPATPPARVPDSHGLSLPAG